MVGKDLIMATLFGSGGGSSGGGGEGEKSPLDALIDGSITEVNSNVETVASYKFYYCQSLKSASFPLAKKIEANAFDYCRGLSAVNFPLVESIGTSAFIHCNIREICFPNVISCGSAVFKYSNVVNAVFPAANSVFASMFMECNKLEKADFSVATTVNNYAFNNCYPLKALILRGTTMATLKDANAFGNCYHILGTVNGNHNPDGLKDGYIYVPRALVDSYKAATNWSTFAGQFRALEDYTVDGTITGELDESKI